MNLKRLLDHEISHWKQRKKWKNLTAVGQYHSDIWAIGNLRRGIVTSRKYLENTKTGILKDSDRYLRSSKNTKALEIILCARYPSLVVEKFKKKE